MLFQLAGAFANFRYEHVGGARHMAALPFCWRADGAAPDSELHGLRQHSDDSESTGAAALAREADTPRLRRTDHADFGPREPVWSV
jgi:hypothetical protein